MESKVLKKFFAVLIIMVTFFQNIVGVYATNFVPNPITVIYEHEYTGLGSDGSSIVVRKIKYTDQTGKTKYGFAYCLEGGGGDVFVDDDYRLDGTDGFADKITGEVDDDGLRYITTNGFWGNGNVSSGATTNDENIQFSVTQLAIWLYYYDISLNEDKYDMEINDRRISSLAKEVRAGRYDTSNSTFVRIVKDANKLCEAAKQARLVQVECQKNEDKCPVDYKESLDVKVDNTNLKLSEDGKYLESDLISVSLTKISVANVGVSDDRFAIVSESGEEVASVKNGDKVKIRIELEKVTDKLSVKITFEATSNERIPYQYHGGTYIYDGSTLLKQRQLFSAGVTTLTLKETLDFDYEIGKIDVEFSKIDVTTGKELPGATLEVRDSNGKLIESWVSTEETHFIKLAPGKYTLTEIIAPEGYELSTETIEFEVKSDGTTTKVVMENKPIAVDVEFSKIDVTTGKELPGATLEVRDSNGKLIESWVSTEETHFIKLAPGKYTLTEIIAPEGYELSTETIEFEVKSDGTTTKVVMENKPYIEVPITSLNASSTTMVIGSLLIGLGLIVVYTYVKKYEA